MSLKISGGMTENGASFLNQADLPAMTPSIKVFRWKPNGFKNIDYIFFNDSY